MSVCVSVVQGKEWESIFLLNYSLVLFNYLHFHIFDCGYFSSSVHVSFTTSVKNIISVTFILNLILKRKKYFTDLKVTEKYCLIPGE